MPIFSRNPIMLAGEDIQPETTGTEEFLTLARQAAQGGMIGIFARTESLTLAEEGRGPSAYAYAKTGMDTSITPTSPRLSPEQARQKLRDNGLAESLSVPETGIREATLDILMDRKREELYRQRILSQSTGTMNTIAGLMGALAGSLVDPTNIALAFVPVVGEARYAQLLRSAAGPLGRTGVRVGVGGVEGLVGIAPVEALNYYAKMREQADYDAYDFMLGVAGGAFFGSTLHAGAGLLGDVLRPTQWSRQAPLPPRVGEPTPTAEVPQFPIVDNVVARERALVMERLAEGKPVTRAQAVAERQAAMARTGAEAGQIIDVRLEALQRESADGLLPADQVKALVKEGDELEALVRQQDRMEKQGVRLSPEGSLTPQERELADARRMEIKQQLEAHKRAQAAGKELEKLQKRLDRIDSDGDLIKLADELMPRTDGEKFYDSLSPEVRKAVDEDPFMDVRPFVASLQPETQANALRMAISQAASGRPIDVTSAVLTDPRYYDPNGAFAAAQRNAAEVDGANQRASEWADTVEPMPDDVESARAVTDETVADVTERLKAAGLELDEATNEALTDLATLAKAQGNAAKAAAMCMMRTGG